MSIVWYMYVYVLITYVNRWWGSPNLYFSSLYWSHGSVTFSSPLWVRWGHMTEFLFYLIVAIFRPHHIPPSMPSILNNPSLWSAVEDLYEDAKALEDGWATLREDTESLNCGMEQSTTQLSARTENIEWERNLHYIKMHQNLIIIFYCITSHLKTQWFKTIAMLVLCVLSHSVVSDPLWPRRL